MVMHDIFEGITHLVFCAVLQHLLNNRILDIPAINKIFRDYSSFSPTSITMYHLNECRIPFSASQILYWLQFFCARFGCFYEDEEKESIWKLVLTHCKISGIILSPGICSDETVQYLQDLIFEQNVLLSIIFPSNIKYKCKLHNISHYPALIKTFGSLANFPTMRFESLHQYFKQVMRKLKQYPKMLSFRFQRRHAIISPERLKSVVECTSSEPFFLNELDIAHRESISEHFDGNVPFKDVKFSYRIKFDGYDYFCKKKQTVIVLDFDEDINMPVFGIVTHILFVKEKWVLLIQKLVSSFEPHFNAYIVTKRLSEVICKSPSSPMHPPLTVFILAGYQAVCLKHDISNS